MPASVVFKHFPELTEKQREQFEALYALYRDWNAKINVISRRDIDNLYEHHVLHSLGITEAIHFQRGTEVMDIGTGGGFPGVPLAIMFPECRFHLIDSIGKKIRVATAVAEAIGLDNVTLAHRNAIEEKGKFDFVVSRAVMKLSDLANLVRKNISQMQRNALPNGILCLKGGDLQAELRPFKRTAEVWPLEKVFPYEYYAGKNVVYVRP